MQEFFLNPALGQALALTAASLLLFVSVAVIYLSTIEWRDRRRRRGTARKG